MHYPSDPNQLLYYYNSTNQNTNNLNGNIFQSAFYPFYQSAQNTSYIYSKTYPNNEYSIQCQLANQVPLLIVHPQLVRNVNPYPSYLCGPTYAPKYCQPAPPLLNNRQFNFNEQFSLINETASPSSFSV